MKKLAENLWVVETEFKLFGAEFGNRMTVVRLGDGGLLLHSPVKIDEKVLAGVKSLGQVTYLVTPNNFHGLFVEEWQAEFPGARHFSAKPETRQGDASFPLDSLVGESTAAEIEIIKLNGAPKVNEYALIHKASHTLILTDIAFNIGANVSRWSKLFFTLNGAFNRFGPSRLMKNMISDPEALNVSIDKLLAYDIERIIVSHGDILESNTSAELKQAFAGCVPSRSGKSTTRFSLSRCG